MNFIRLFFLRHGQTENFESPPFNGWRNAPLTAFGKKQLETNAQNLKDIKFEAIYSSDLDRARYGAEMLKQYSSAPHIIDEGWREISFGEWEGLTWQEIHQKEPKLAKKIFSPKGTGVKFPNGESLNSFYKRMKNSLTHLQNSHKKEPVNIALYAHSGVCRAIIAALINMPIVTMWSFNQDFAALNIADIYANKSAVIHLVNAKLDKNEDYLSKFNNL